MNPITYLAAFAWLSLVALSCSFLSDHWLPVLIGASVVTLLGRLAR